MNNMHSSTKEKSGPSSHPNPQLSSENPLIQMIRDIPIPFRLEKKKIEEVLDFKPQDGDIIIATYPKTGTTWVQYIILQILTRGEHFPTFNDMLEKIVPYLEFAGVAAVDRMTTRPRVYKHHMPYDVMNKNPNAKIVYVYRKPEDTLVSYYHFTNAVTGLIDFDQFFENFLIGSVSYGRYFEHILTYLEHKDDKNILFVSYEKLQANTKQEILRIAHFLGENYYNSLLDDEQILNKIIEHTEFNYMKKNLTLFDPKDVQQKEIEFFRKGKIGDGKNSLNEEQLDRLQKLAEDIMKGTDILREWFEE